MRYIKRVIAHDTWFLTIELVDIECVLGDVSYSKLGISPDFALIMPPFWILRTLFL